MWCGGVVLCSGFPWVSGSTRETGKQLPLCWRGGVVRRSERSEVKERRSECLMRVRREMKKGSKVWGVYVLLHNDFVTLLNENGSRAGLTWPTGWHDGSMGLSGRVVSDLWAENSYPTLFFWRAGSSGLTHFANPSQSF